MLRTSSNASRHPAYLLAKKTSISGRFCGDSGIHVSSRACGLARSAVGGDNRVVMARMAVLAG
jgi:hypothetical protein